MNAVETPGVLDAQHQLRLDERLPIPGQSRFLVIVVVPDAYTAVDGKPFHD